MSPQAFKAFKHMAAAQAAVPATPGERAYRDYFQLREGVNSQGGPLPAWGELSVEIRAWWEHAGVQPPGAPRWWENKVFWLNAIILGAAAAEERLGLLQDVLPGSVFVWVAFGLPVLNKAIRAFQLFRAIP
ncbi:MAG: hypothetical protein Q7K57_47415 [Burkholderiaceae bacterium]|nr:hypothetical protein [Burkholderiaceae bacterium]